MSVPNIYTELYYNTYYVPDIYTYMPLFQASVPVGNTFMSLGQVNTYIYLYIVGNTCISMFQTFKPLAADLTLQADAHPVEFLHDRHLQFMDYANLQPYQVSKTVSS